MDIGLVPSRCASKKTSKQKSDASSSLSLSSKRKRRRSVNKVSFAPITYPENKDEISKYNTKMEKWTEKRRHLTSWESQEQNVADTDINVSNTDFIVTIDEKKNLQLNLGQYIDEEKNMKHCLVFKTCLKNMVLKSEDSRILLQNVHRILKYVKCKLFFIFPLNKNGLYVKTVRLYGREEWSIILCDRGNVIDMTVEGLEILYHVSALLKLFV